MDIDEWNPSIYPPPPPPLPPFIIKTIKSMYSSFYLLIDKLNPDVYSFLYFFI